MTAALAGMDPADLTTGQRYRSFAAILASIFGVGISIGMSMPLVSIVLEREGFSSTVIGLNAGAYAAAMLIAGPLVPKLLRRLSVVRVLFLGTGLAAVSMLALIVVPPIAAWFGLRILMGIGNALDWVTSETWINALATRHDRGRLIAIYAVVWGGGITVGPLVLAAIGTQGPWPFLVAGGLQILAFLPVLAARRLAPRIHTEGSARALLTIALAVPVAIAAAVASGVGESAITALLPVLAVMVEYPERVAVVLVAVFGAGGLVLQWPIGWLADRVDRMGLLFALAVTTLVATGLVPVTLGSVMALGAVLFVWGGAIAGLYTVGLTLLGERYAAGDMAAANAAFVAAYTFAMTAAPGAVGAGMEAIGPTGMPAVLGIAYAGFSVLCGVAWWRGRVSEPRSAGPG